MTRINCCWKKRCERRFCGRWLNRFKVTSRGPAGIPTTVAGLSVTSWVVPGSTVTRQDFFFSFSPPRDRQGIGRNQATGHRKNGSWCVWDLDPPSTTPHDSRSRSSWPHLLIFPSFLRSSLSLSLSLSSGRYPRTSTLHTRSLTPVWVYPSLN